MIKRLGVFCFYDENGIVDEYVVHCLKDLQTVLSHLVIIINGEIKESELKKLTAVSEDVYLRENLGFDGGAYAYYFVDVIGRGAIEEWDEIVLCNNSFFGPFLPFNEMFSVMEKKEGDCWGIRYIDRDLYAYLESYFLVFRTKIIKEGALFDYFNETKRHLEHATYLEVCSCFERGIFSFLIQRKYTFTYYSKKNYYDIFSSADVNIVKYSVPILKKKSLDTQKYPENQLDVVMTYLQENTSYNIGMIEDYAKRVYGDSYHFKINNKLNMQERFITAKRIAEYACKKSQLDEFIQKHRQVYIYGNGILAGNLWWAYKHLIKEFKGFIVSKPENRTSNTYFGERVLTKDELVGESNIILALSKSNTTAVRNTLLDANVISMWDIEREK